MSKNNFFNLFQGTTPSLPSLPKAPSKSYSDPREGADHRKKNVFKLHNPYSKEGMPVYTGKRGRPKNSGNYKKEFFKHGEKAGKLKAVTNIHGVRFTAKEKAEYEREVRKANEIAKKLANDPAGMLFGLDMSGSLLTRTTHFALQEKTTSLNEITSKDYFKRYMKELKTINKSYKNGDSIIDRQANEMKRRLIKALDKTMPIGNTKDAIAVSKMNKIKKRIREMSVEEFAFKYAEDFFGTLTEWYKEENISSKDNMDDLLNRLEGDAFSYTRENIEGTRFEKTFKEKKPKQAKKAKKAKTPSKSKKKLN